jgi:hypothetical protein
VSALPQKRTCGEPAQEFANWRQSELAPWRFPKYADTREHPHLDKAMGHGRPPSLPTHPTEIDVASKWSATPSRAIAASEKVTCMPNRSCIITASGGSGAVTGVSTIGVISHVRIAPQSSRRGLGAKPTSKLAVIASRSFQCADRVRTT